MVIIDEIMFDSDPVKAWVPVFDVNGEESSITQIGVEPLLDDDLARRLREHEAIDDVLELVRSHPEDPLHPSCVNEDGVIGWGYAGEDVAWNVTLVVITQDAVEFYCEGCANARVSSDG